jgi:uncharacterized damage-inducible protein DinB
MPSREVEVLLAALDQAYDRKSWHGTNLRGSLRGLTPRQAAYRPAPGRHNIWEIVVHAAYWKYVVRRRLLGEPRGSFPLKGSNWFTRPTGGQLATAWRADLALLDQSHRALRESVASMAASDLAPDASGPVTPLYLITGVAAHDLYHAGQIQLLKRLQPGRSAGRTP